MRIKIRPLYLSINFEATRLAQTLSYLHRYSGNWYQHAQIIEGYTNENQIIGSGTGLGNNMQNLVFSYNIGISKIGLIDFTWPVKKTC